MLIDVGQGDHPDQNVRVYVCANVLSRDGVPLDAAIRLAREAGADGFAVRRDLLSEALSSADIAGIRAALSVLPAPAFYSSPQTMFHHGPVERDEVTHALAEARKFWCRPATLAAGDTLQPDDVALDAFCETITTAADGAVPMHLWLENDQTAVSGARHPRRAHPDTRARPGAGTG